MNRDVAALLAAQFLNAFANNALLFTAVAMAMQMHHAVPWYIPALQASFLVAFVVLAPWVGPYADRRPKAMVLILANIVMAGGAGLMLFGMEPLFAYALVGAGAAIYSPAKYGILPELVAEHELVRVNGWVEGSTIMAIVAGSLAGGLLADRSISLALLVVVSLYIVSAAVAMLITRMQPAKRPMHAALPHFALTIAMLLANSRARFATLGVSLFWAAAVVLRVMIVAWAPAVLLINKTADIAELTLYSAIGIAIGALLAARVIPIAKLRRARLAGYAMGISIALLYLVDTVWSARAVLLAAGVCGGLFIVPINAALQEIGHRSVGSGGAVAIQQFFENLAMLAATGTYALVAGYGGNPVTSLLILGLLVVAATAAVSWRLPPETAMRPEAVAIEKSTGGD